MHLDPQSSYIYNIPASLLMGGFLLAVARTYTGDIPGLRLWAVALLVRSLGMLLTALNGQIADLLSLLLGSALIQVSLALYYQAMLDFLGHGGRPRWPFWLILASTLAQGHAVLVLDDLNLKISLYAFSSLPILGATTYLLLWQRRPGTLSQTLTGIVFLCTLPVGLLRGIHYALRLGQPESSPFHENLVQDISYLSSYISALLATFGFLMMCSDRYRAERRQAEATIQRMAFHDPLTDLPNRRLLHERLPQAIEDWRRQGTPLAVFMLDLDRFKSVNDEFGHAAGDELLRQVAQRLRALLPPVDLLARLGGDEFIVLIHHSDDPARLSQLARTLIERLNQPFDLGLAEPVSVGASIGIARCPLHGQDAAALLRAADRALYEVKGGGRGSFRHVTEAAPLDASRRATDR